jgi:hypothetical protein
MVLAEPPHMTGTTLDDVEDDLERATELETEEALSVLRAAKRDLDALDDVDEERREALEDRLDQRLRAVDERDAYDGNLGASMNPDDDDAP